MFIACWPWGKYLGEEAEKGVDVCVSSWRRIAADSMPAVAKATGNYLNGQLIKIEAVTNGYAEGLALDARGFVSEGSGENVFMVQDGVLLTPPLAASVLQGITRDTVIKIARDLEIPVREEQIPRGQLYTCGPVPMLEAVNDRFRRDDGIRQHRGDALLGDLGPAGGLTAGG